MQQPSTIYTTYYPTSVYQDGNGASHQWTNDFSKPNQYPAQWDNNGGQFHVTAASNYASQVQGGGGQSRVPVNSLAQTPQQPTQPPPTSTPPGIHGDMSKQPAMQNQQPAQINYVQSRAIQNFQGYRTAMAQPQPIRSQGRIVQGFNMPMPPGAVQTSAPIPVLTQYPGGLGIMYTGQRPPFQSPAYPTLMQQQYYNHPPQYFHTPVIQPTYSNIPAGGGPSPQAAGQTSVPIMRPPAMPNPTVQNNTTVKAEKKRSHAIKIIDPTTNEEVPIDTDSSGNNNNITPTRSNDSSARETPQPNAGVSVVDNNLAADFAARVAARALADEPPPPPSDHSQDSLLNDSEVHKQLPTVVPSSEKIFNTTLSTKSAEFVPSSLKQPSPCEPTIEETRTPIVPTVSAETNSPAVEIQRKEQFSAMKNTAVPLQSPLKAGGNAKKQKGTENERTQLADIPASVQESPPDNKKGPKVVQKEETSQPPKERREKTRSVSKEQSPAPSPVELAEVPVVPVIQPTPLALAPVLKSSSVVVSVEEHTVTEAPAPKVLQHQNGENAIPEPPPAVPADGNKTAQRPNKKKGGKMRELNRKVVDKEGSDMDAFVTDSIVSEERPATPASPPPPATPTPPISTDKITEDLEEKEVKLVAAKNVENAKVSAVIRPEEPAPVIEKPTPAPAPAPAPVLAPQPPTLKHSYKEGQWSPLNLEGKKKYGRDFLMELKQQPQSNVKPDNLPDIVAVIRDSNNMRNQSMSYIGTRGDMGTMIPSFIHRSSQSQRGGQMVKRDSMKGNNRGGGGGGGKPSPKLIQMSLSLNEDVKLKSVDNAWKPNRLDNKSEQEKGTEDLYKKVRGILNKLTPQKFDQLMLKFRTLPIDNEERLVGVINLIFDKAVDEPNFSKAYANMCKLCSKLEVTKTENGEEQKVNFRKILITRCQHEFENMKPAEIEAAKYLEDIKNCTDPDKKKDLQLQYEEKERQMRMKSVGNIRFIGELFKLGMLTSAIMYRCIEHLLKTPEEESLECLCKLLTTIGKDLESGGKDTTPKASLDPYFQRMSELAQKKESSKVSSRVRFMLQDVIELRSSRWVPRREDNNPKTIEQINKEAEQELQVQNSALSQQPPRMRQNDRPDDRKRGNRGGNNQDDGWISIPASNRYHQNKYTTPFEASKMQNVKPEIDLQSLSLGGSQQFRFNPAAKTIDNKAAPTYITSNFFSALSERKPPPPTNMSNRRITPSPSIEKESERKRMMQGMDNDGRNSRGSSAQRDRPQPLSQPPSRDSSVPRHVPDNKEVSEKRVDEKAAQQAEELLERQTATIVAEYLTNVVTVNDVRQDIEQIYPADKSGEFVRKVLEISLEKKAADQKNIGLLITALMDSDLLTQEIIVEQFGLIYENAEDIAIDVPKVHEFQANIVAPIMAAGKINFSHFREACRSVLKTKSASKLLVPVLNLLAKEKSVGFVRQVWDSSNVSLKDFVPDDTNVDNFIKENSLEYLTGEAPKYDSSSNQLPMDQVQGKMLSLIQSNQPYEKILDFISSNVGERVEDLQFIRALITAICEACIQAPGHTLDVARFTQYEKLLVRFVDTKEDRELACLSAVHILVCRLEHPQGLIKNIFNLFLEHSLISTDSFLKWKEDDKEKLENKGVSNYALTSFFFALTEAESEDENS